MLARPGSKTRSQVWRVSNGNWSKQDDLLATEEPMEIRLLAGGERRSVSVTMRTPGSDFELAAGFLYTEGIIPDRQAIARISYCREPQPAEESRFNVVHMELTSDRWPALDHLARTTFTSSACGVCGKAGLEALERRDLAPLAPGPEIAPEVILGLADQLRVRQGVFEATGGLHAAALFDTHGELLALREDVGRHNAVDKLIGWALLGGGLPWDDRIVLVSGRAGYEIIQKLIVARAPVVCAISAPSSLAVDLARAFNQTLIGFLRDGRFNLYSGRERIRAAERLTA